MPCIFRAGLKQTWSRVGIRWLGVGESAVYHAGEGCKDMAIGLGLRQNVPYCAAAADQGISEKGAVATPGDRLRTHDRGGGILSQRHQLFDAGPERGGLHIIRIAAKTRIAPSQIDGVRTAFPAASQGRRRLVLEACACKAPRQDVCIELGIPSRIGDDPNIHQPENPVRVQERGELLNRPRGMTDSPESGRHSINSIQRSAVR